MSKIEPKNDSNEESPKTLVEHLEKALDIQPTNPKRPTAKIEPQNGSTKEMSDSQISKTLVEYLEMALDFQNISEQLSAHEEAINDKNSPVTKLPIWDGMKNEIKEELEYLTEQAELSKNKILSLFQLLNSVMRMGKVYPHETGLIFLLAISEKESEKDYEYNEIYGRKIIIITPNATKYVDEWHLVPEDVSSEESEFWA